MIKDIIATANAGGVELYHDHQKLKFRAPKGALPPELKQTIAANKEGILAYLMQESEASDTSALSFNQRGMWLTQKVAQEDVGQYNMPFAFNLHGAFDVEAFYQAINGIIARHDVLRACFFEENGEVLQRIQKTVLLSPKVTEVAGQGDAQTAAVKGLIQQREATAFDLETGPLVRAEVLRCSDTHHVAVFVIHHIVFDGWSINLFIRELLELYVSHLTGLASSLPEPEVSFTDFVSWQSQYFQGDKLQAELDYWSQKLQDVPPLHSLPTDRMRPAVQTFAGATLSVRTDRALTERIAHFCQLLDINANGFFHAMLTLLIYRLSGASTVVLGCAVSGRHRSEFEGLLGYFVNTLAVCQSPDSQCRVRDFIKDSKRALLDAYSHDILPLSMLLEHLQYERNPSYSPLFQIVYAYHQNSPLTEQSFAGLDISLVSSEEQSSKFDVMVTVREGEGQFRVDWNYNTDLFTEVTIARFADGFMTLIDNVIQEPEQTVGQVSCLSPSAQATLADWNAAADKDAPGVEGHASVLEAFAASVQLHPNAPAVSDAEQTLSYGTLDALSDRIAAFFIHEGLQRDEIVAVGLGRDAHWLAVALGILKAGGAFTSVTQAMSEERVAYILDDTRARFLVVESIETFADVESLARQVTVAEMEEAAADETFQAVKGRTIDSDQLAYVIYTSGSTGKPKGVMIEHGAFANFFVGLPQQMALDCDFRCSWWASQSFDVSVVELFLPLHFGGSLHVIPEAIRPSPSVVFGYLAAQQISHAFLPKAFLEPLIAYYQESGSEALSLKTIWTGVESIPTRVFKSLSEEVPGIILINAYGPTETTCCATSLVYDPKAQEQFLNAPIGRVSRHYSLYVLDETQQQVPIGTTGELYIGGRSLARGYLHRDDLTTQAFVETRFGRLYRTGDYVRFLHQGEVQFIGRVDNQVSVSGYRVELGEIESQLRLHEQVLDCAVVDIQNPRSETVLVAWVAVQGEATSLLGHELRSYLSHKLPYYMLPNIIEFLPELPVTSHNKVDLKLLRQKSVARDHEPGFVAGRYEIEASLVEIWLEVLGLESVSITDNFFRVGGNSLTAIKIAARLSQKFSVELSLESIFKAPMLSDIAFNVLQQYALTLQQETQLNDLLQTLPEDVAKKLHLSQSLRPDFSEEPSRTSSVYSSPEIKKVINEDHQYLTSFSQRRLWFIDQMEGNSVHYNMSGAVRVNGPLNVEGVKYAVGLLLNQHHVLRSTYHYINDDVYQTLEQIYQLPVMSREATAAGSHERSEQIKTFLIEEFQTPFDLSRDLMFRVNILKLTESEHILAFTLHHIAGDGWSFNLLQNEFFHHYEEFISGKFDSDDEQDLAKYQDSPSKDNSSLQYSDFASWQREQFTHEAIAQKMGYWRAKLEGSPDLHALPLDYSYSDQVGYVADSLKTPVSRKTQQALQNLAVQNNVSLSTVLHTAFALLVSRWSGAEYVNIALPHLGRSKVELESVIGFFSDTAIVTSHLDSNLTFAQLLQQNTTSIIEAQGSQCLPFDILVDQLNIPRNASYNPLAQLKFVLQDFDSMTSRQQKTFAGLDINWEVPEIEFVRFDLDLSATLATDLSLKWTYKTGLFKEQTIQNLADAYLLLLERVVAEPAAKIGHYPHLSQVLQKQILAKSTGPEYTPQTQDLFHQCFEQIAAKSPDNVALRTDSCQLSYQWLNQKANRLAHAMLELEIEPEEAVVIYCTRTAPLLIAMLGTMKVGANYIVVDPEVHLSQLPYVLTDSDCQLLLTHADDLARAAVKGVDFLLLDDALTSDGWLSEYSQLDVAEEELDISPSSALYTVYTSGSTGKPKGVSVSHTALMDYCSFALQNYYADHLAGSLVVTSPSFDLSYPGLLLPLMKGDCVDLMPPNQQFEVVRDKLLAAQQSYLMRATPAHIKIILDLLPKDQDAIPGAHVFVIGGDKLEASLARRLQRRFPDSILYNHYGPSETVIGCAMFNFTANQHQDHNDVLPIGKPMHNTQFYVLDQYQGLCPENATGELYIGGRCVSNGYLNNAPLTAEKFVPNPLGGHLGKEDIVYRSGDLVKLLDDGNFQFIGRVDNQVKIRGFRIELAHIEAQLLDMACIEECAVVRNRADEQEFLKCFIIPENGIDIDIEDVKRQLGKTLPDYMVPSFFEVASVLPLTANGKIDRKTLETRRFTQTTSAFAEASTAKEIAMCEVWQTHLSRQVGIDDNYFAVGGDSIRAISLVAKCAGQGLKFSVADLYEQQTIRKLCHLIDTSGPAENCDPAPLELLQPTWERLAHQYDGVEDIYPVTSMQKVMLEWHQKSSKIYNTQALYHFEIENFSVMTLETALSLLFLKHKTLRTRFVEDEELGFVQLVVPHQDVRLEIINHKVDTFRVSDPETDAFLESFMLEDMEMEYRYHVASATVRMGLVDYGNNRWGLFRSMHHAITDGWSNSELLNDLMDTYSALAQGQSPEVQHSGNVYKEHVALEHEAAGDSQQQQAWREIFSEYCYQPLFDKHQLADVSDERSQLAFQLDTHLIELLQQSTLKANANLKTAVVLAYQRGLLSLAWRNQSGNHHRESLAIELVTNGRTARLSDPQGAYGLFWTSLPVPFKTTVDIRHDLSRLSQLINKVNAHSLYPRHRIMAENALSNDWLPVLNFVNFHNLTPQQERPNGNSVQAVFGRDYYHHPLKLFSSFNQNQGRMQCVLEFDSQMFNQADMECIRDELITCLYTIVGQ